MMTNFSNFEHFHKNINFSDFVGIKIFHKFCKNSFNKRIAQSDLYQFPCHNIFKISQLNLSLVGRYKTELQIKLHGMSFIDKIDKHFA